MIKLTIIGAGSAVFTKNIFTDLMFIDDFKKMDIALVDIDEKRLKISHELLDVIAKKLNASPNIKSYTNRKEALKEVNRPQGSENWEFFTDAQPLAWKTGTSYGFKDAWAVGVTPKYAIGVWVGNADGEGRPGITGVEAAAPILFDVLNLLPNASWFETPYTCRI